MDVLIRRAGKWFVRRGNTRVGPFQTKAEACAACEQPMNSPPCMRSPDGAGGHAVAGRGVNGPAQQ